MAGLAGAAPPRWQPRTQRAGEWELTALSSGWLRLDGGSMWGVVPATMWRDWTPPDEDNTIRLACRPFLARRGKHVVVIEPGIGTRWEEKWRRIYKIESVDTLEETLARCGVTPEQVTHVVDSHCHWDHIGSQVVSNHGKLEPLFPNARHFAPKIEIAMAKKPGHARAASYRAEDVLCIEQRGLLESYAGTQELLPGLVAHELGGHSDGVSVITLGEGSERAIFWSDVVPTTHHVQPPYIMAYDLDVVRSFEVRSQWLEQAARGGWLGMFFHDEHVPFARIVKDGRRYRSDPVSA
jgi:glyoxylase-like metal-dependent hydrolase (beta-lactamase superfamily II)